MDWARREVFDMALEIDKIIEKKLSEQEAEDLIEDLKKILSNRWDNAVRESLIWAIGTLEKIKTDPSIAEAEMIEARVRAILNMPVEEAKRRQLLEIQEGAFMRGAKAAAKGISGVSIAWNTEDIKALNTLDENLQFWIGSFFDDNLQEGFKATLQDYFVGGYNRKQLVELMYTHFRTLGKKGDAYWDLLADHTVTKTREIGRVSGYEQAGVDAVRIKARVDDKTSAICRKLNGKVIAVSDIRNQVGKYLDACDTRNKDKIKKAWPWWSDKDVENKLKNNSSINRNINRGKIGLPPYHGRCRTITVAEFYAKPGDVVEDDKKE